MRHGRTLGSPDRGAGRQPRLPELGRADEPLAGRGEVEESHLPRPGHADLAGAQKYGFTRRPQRARARQRPRDRGARRRRRARQGLPARPRRQRPQPRAPDRLGQGPRARATSTPADFEGVDDDPVRCLDAEAASAMVAEIDRLRKANESLGGKFEVRAFGLVPGLGSHVSWEDRLDGRLAQAVCSIQSVKGVALGEAWDVAGRPGSEAHDEIFWSRRARLLPRDQPRRRPRGRHDQRRAAGRAGRDQADLDPDPAAALGRHRDQGARAGDARAHRLDGRPGRRRRRRGDGRAWCWPAPTARSSAATTSTTCCAAIDAYKERIGWRG